MPIQSLPRYLLNAGELAAIGVRLDTLLGEAPAGDDHLMDLRAFLAKNTAAIEARYGKISENMFTGQLAKADDERDRVCGKLSRSLNGKRSDFDPVVAESSEQLYLLFKSHDFGATQKSYAVESTEIRSFLDDLNTPAMADAIEKAGIGAAIKMLKEKQEAFEQIHSQKINDAASMSGDPLSSLLAPVRQDLFDILAHLGSKERTKPTEYAPFIVKVNALIAEMSAKAHARKTRKEASGETNETAKELADVGQGSE